MSAVFVVGTDTGVGKSVISGLLARFLYDRGFRVITQKWVQTGSNNFSADIASHLRLMGRKKQDLKDCLSHLCPYVFKFPSSPHLASSLERRRISPAKIKKSFLFLSQRFDFVLVEGTGGALVPLNRRNLLIDIARELNLPVLVVAGNRLGAINHTLLTIEAVKKRKMKIIGVIYNNQSGKINRVILKDNPRIVKKLSGETILGVLPWCKSKSFLYKTFIPIGERIFARLK